MQERKFGSAFRLSSKQSDTMKMNNSLGQLLGAESTKRVEDYPRGSDSNIDVPAAQSTSTLIRCGAGSRSASKENRAHNNIGSKATSTSFMTPDFTEKLFGAQGGLFAKLKPTTEEIPSAKKSQTQGDDGIARLFAEAKMQMNFQNLPVPKLEKGFDVILNMFSGFSKPPGVLNPPFSLEALTEASNKHHKQMFLPKIEHLRSLEQQLMAQTSENRFGSKKIAVAQNASMNSHNRRGSFPEISSLNSMDEELDANTKTTSFASNLSISSLNNLDFSPKRFLNDLTLSTKRSEEYKPCTSESFLDFSSASLEQKLEVHHTKNSKCKSPDSESSEPKGAPKSALGSYSFNERISKILKYKKKIIKWRAAHPPNRSFTGRSAVAGSKPRIKGKFVKKDEYQKFMDVQKCSPVN